MSELSIDAGQLLSGKEGQRSDELSVLAKQAKLIRGSQDTSGTEPVATKCDDIETQDEFFNDALMRFGIKI